MKKITLDNKKIKQQREKLGISREELVKILRNNFDHTFSSQWLYYLEGGHRQPLNNVFKTQKTKKKSKISETIDMIIHNNQNQENKDHG
jgi:hypothetical protein